MAKSYILGNGTINVGFNEKGLVSDFFYPYVGLENQVQGGLAHRIAVYVDGKYRALYNNDFDIKTDLLPGTLASDVHCTAEDIGVELRLRDTVYNEKNVLQRRCTVTNQSATTREIKVFFSQVFGIYGTPLQDTAYFDPAANVLIHYEGRRVFLIYAEVSDVPFDQYSVGLYMSEGKEGTHKDAEDGQLEKNGIEHGQVDSTLGLTLKLYPGESKEISYYIIVGESKQEVYDIHSYVKYKGFNYLQETTMDFWSAWVKRNEPQFCDLSDKTIDLYHKSLFYIRSNIDNRGAIIASGDSDMLQRGRDTYSYMWPRDGALTVLALLEAGEYSVSKRFFKFCNDVQEQDGYLMHKYRSDRSLGSSWEPFIDHGEVRLPIQEDETALVLYALWKYYEKTKEIEFIEQHYADFIHRAGMFLADYIDKETGLPKQSYDLWEEKFGTSTFTASTVYAGLTAAASFADLLGKHSYGHYFTTIAERMKKSIADNLYVEEIDSFCKLIQLKESGNIYDNTIDISSVYGVFAFGVLDPEDERVKKSIKTIEELLVNKNGIGGVPRYVNDKYFTEVEGKPNPWYICTLWLTQYYISISKTLAELSKAHEYFDWVIKYTPKAGAMSEQLHFGNGTQLSATPLTWSHAEYIRTVHMYIDKYSNLK
jgi:GH15 family glucan-1,4-alpha-glucosidase